MKKNGQRIFFISVAYAETAGFCRFIKTAHVPTDSDSLVFTKTHKALDYKNGFFAVAEGELVVNGVIRNFFPLTAFVFCVAVAYGVKIRFADIVEKSADRNGFAVSYSIFGTAFFKKLINVKAVLNKTGGNMPLGILAWLIVGLVMIVCAYVFAVMATRYERVNGVVDYAEATVGDRYAYNMGWFSAMIHIPSLVSAVGWIAARYFCVLMGWDITGGACMTIAATFIAFWEKPDSRHSPSSLSTIGTVSVLLHRFQNINLGIL